MAGTFEHGMVNHMNIDPCPLLNGMNPPSTEVSQAVAAARGRLASIQSYAAGAAKDLKRAQREEHRAAEALEEREMLS